MITLKTALHLAAQGDEEELRSLAHHTSERVVSLLLVNQNLTEDIVLLIAGRRNIGPDHLETISMDRRWRDSYRVKLSLCKNPKTPHRISLALLKNIRIMDLGDLARNHRIPTILRTAAVSHIAEKMLSLPLGIKTALARRAERNVLLKLLEDGMKEVVSVCLDSPSMTEAILIKVINAKRTTSNIIRQIAEHPKWSGRHDVQQSLIRNVHAPLVRVTRFLEELSVGELRELYADPAVPSGTKPFIFRGLADRNPSFR